jgi:hypothetical protein
MKVVLLFVPGSGAGGDDFGSNLLSQEVFRGEQFFLIILFFIIQEIFLSTSGTLLFSVQTCIAC